MSLPSSFRHLGLAPLLLLATLFASSTSIAEPSTEPVSYVGTMLIQLRVADLERSVTFYEEIMGFEVQNREGRGRLVRVRPGVDGVTLGLSQGESAGSGTLSLNFGVVDLDAARQRLERLGVEFLGPTREIPGVVRFADLQDPDGHRIRLTGYAG